MKPRATECPVCGRPMPRPGCYKMQLLREVEDVAGLKLRSVESTLMCPRCAAAVRKLVRLIREQGW